MPALLTNDYHSVRVEISGQEVVSPQLFRAIEPWSIYNQSIPVPGRFNPVYFTLQGKWYVGGGRGTGELNDFYMSEPGSNSWTKKANIPHRGNILASFATGEYGYCITSESLSVFRYNPEIDQWTSISPVTGASVFQYLAMVIEGVAYVMTTESSASIKWDLWRLNEADGSWEYLTVLNSNEFRHGVGFSIGKYGYVALGHSPRNDSSKIMRYDPASNSWELAMDVTQIISGSLKNRLNSSVFVANGQAFFIGGRTSLATTTAMSDVYRFDPEDKSFVMIQDMPEGGRFGTFAFGYNSFGIIGMGNMNGMVRSDILKLDLQMLPIEK